MEDLNTAVDAAAREVDVAPEDHPDIAVYLNNLGTRLGIRFLNTGSMEDLNNALDAVFRAVEATPEDHPLFALYSNNLANWLEKRFERTDSIDDINRAVTAATRALEAMPEGHQDRAVYLYGIANRLGKRFERTDSMEDLNRAVTAAAKAVDLTSQDHSDLDVFLNGLGIWLGARFERTGSMEDLNNAVDAVFSAVEATPESHPLFAAYSNNLANWLVKRFERRGSMNDLNNAVDSAFRAVGVTPEDHPQFAVCLNSLGTCLGARFERTGSVDDMNRAVDAATRAVNATTADHPDLAMFLNSLGNRLGMRFERTNSMEDLNRAVNAATRAVEVTPEGHPDLSMYSYGLASWLGKRFDETSSMEDLNKAIEAVCGAVEAMPEDNPNLAMCLNSLGTWLGARFERTSSLEDLSEAVACASRAVETTPKDHPDLAMYQYTLGSQLGKSYERTGSMEDLNSAVDATTKAVEATPATHPNLGLYSYGLGKRLGTRFKRTRSVGDQTRQLASCLVAWECKIAPPSIRIQSAQMAGYISALRQDWEVASQLLRDAVLLVPKVSPRSLKHIDAQNLLAPFSGLASTAAATALSAEKDPQDALGVLDLGRDVIAGLLMDMRVDTSDLRTKHPGLAERFESLRDELDSSMGNLPWMPGEDAVPRESKIRRRWEADREFDELVDIIRDQPEFNDFIQPPAIEEMTAMATTGPIIVVNISAYRCDAFLVEQSGLRTIELPDLTLEDVEVRSAALQTTSDLEPLLEWLWDAICRPCLDALGFTIPIDDGNWPHIWWIPTGLLSWFPLHAAGRYGQGQQTVMDRVVSSYASSIKAVLHGRRHNAQNSNQRPENLALLVAMPETPGLSTNGALPFALEEVHILNELCPSLQLVPTTPSKCKGDVLDQLQRCKLFHFAGHGRLDPADPSQSCLLLEDWQAEKLTVADLRDSRLQENPPFLAYLSACSTGTNRAAELSDEGIHMVSAFKLAGFRHAIGTLWEVSDRHCVKVARILYETLRDEGMTDRAVSYGLHRALRTLRDEGQAENADRRDAKLVSSGTTVCSLGKPYWIPYVHFGA